MNDTKPVCVITGASSGIGLATASWFASHGYRLAICARDRRRLAAATDGLRSQVEPPADILALSTDVGDLSAAQAFLEQAQQTHGRIDVLVNNAGTARLATIAEFPLDDFHASLRANVHAVFATTQAVWPMMQHQSGGTIINISSLAAVDPFPGFSVYGACKAWVELFTKAIAAEGQAHAIRVLALRLGAVETPMLRGLFPEFPAAQTLSPDEVAKMIYRLATEPTEFSSGATIPMSK